MPAPRLKSSRTTKTTPAPFTTKVWTAGRWLVLMVALSITFVVFFLTAIRVTTRAREVKVPDVRGRALSAATNTLAAAGLAMHVEQRKPDDTVAKDHVVSQDPAPGTVIRRERPVRVRVSDGQGGAELPSVVGQAEQTAEVVLTHSHVAIAGRAEIHSALYPVDTVVAQDPLPKEHAGKISLLVNRGGSAASYVMPDVIGALSVRVIDILRRHGFRVTVSAEVPYPGLPPGVVVRQTPQAGFQIGEGDGVQLEVSR
jgi:serine/threonine-protein kinase